MLQDYHAIFGNYPRDARIDPSLLCQELFLEGITTKCFYKARLYRSMVGKLFLICEEGWSIMCKCMSRRPFSASREFRRGSSLERSPLLHACQDLLKLIKK